MDMRRSVDPPRFHLYKFSCFILTLLASGVLLLLPASVLAHVSASPASGNEALPNGILLLSSRPPGATVEVDGKMEGSTPLTLSLPPGKHVAVLQKSGRVPSVDTLLVKPGSRVSVSDSLFPASVASITSVPEGASVFIDSAFVGRTPLYKLSIPVGWHHVSLQMPEYRERNASFFVEPGFSQNMSTHLIPRFGFISVAVSPPDSRVSIDGGYPHTGRISDREISVGWHSMTVSHAGFPTAGPRHFYVGPGYSEKFNAGLNYFSPKAALYSAVVPGLGQFLDGSRVKGSIEFAAMTGALSFMFNSLDHRATRNSDFILADAAYENASTESQAIMARADLEVAASNLTRARDLADAGIIAAGAVYVLTIADALIFNSANHDISITSDTQLSEKQINVFRTDTNIEVGVNFRF